MLEGGSERTGLREGRIIKALSGFYYVQDGEALVECRARGRLRKEGLTPLVGDLVQFSVERTRGTVEHLLPRKNRFYRPAVADLDALVVLASGAVPVTDPFLIDRITAIAGEQNVPVLLCVNKVDLDAGERLAAIYRHAGYPVFQTSAETGEGIEALRAAIWGKVVAFTGNSGVGKSSILNRLDPRFQIRVGEVSDKLGRGRHTTRHVELYRLDGGTYVADTPGFSSFDTERMELVVKEDLQYAFPDFAPYLGGCQFRDCAHLKEPGCKLRGAVARGEVEPTRYESYVRLYERAKEIRGWELR